MQAYAGQTRALGDTIPRALQIVSRLVRVVAGHHIGANAVYPIKHSKGRGIEDDGLPAAFAVQCKVRCLLTAKSGHVRRRCDRTKSRKSAVWARAITYV